MAQETLPAPLEVVASISSQDFSGVVVTKDKRMFIGAPREVDDGSFPTLAEYKNGRMVPYPNEALSLPGNPDPAKRLVGVHGMTLDSDDRMWMIDDGKEAGKPIQQGAVKVVGIDPKTNKVVAWIVFPKGAWLPDSHMNDLRVDLAHGAKGTVYVTDSSFKQNPALIVVDIATGQCRRLLNATRWTDADNRLMTYLERKPHVYSPEHPTMPQGGADGIELSNDNSRLYWISLSGRTLWSAPTEILSNPNTTTDQLEAAIQDEGERPQADGMTKDDQGNFYFGAYDQQSFVRRNPDGSYTLLAHDQRIGWPDALFVQNGYLYATLDQWNRMASLNGGQDLRTPPYIVVRVKLPPTQLAAH
jgi:sugar lactone lactonase YvrE